MESGKIFMEMPINENKFFKEHETTKTHVSVEVVFKCR